MTDAPARPSDLLRVATAVEVKTCPHGHVHVVYYDGEVPIAAIAMTPAECRAFEQHLLVARSSIAAAGTGADEAPQGLAGCEVAGHG